MKYILGDIFQGDFPVSQYYGQRPEYYKQFGLAGHEGVDWACPTGTPILAPFDGVILRSEESPKDYGKFIVIWDPKQLCAVWFCHLSSKDVLQKQSVKRGQVLGATGNTGNTSGPHLHLNFVQTDADGNRLNKNNGYQGFLNVLDGNLVEWKLGQQPTSTVQPIGVLPPNYDEIVGKATSYDNFVAAGFHTVEDVLSRIKEVNDSNAKLTKEIAEAHAQASALASEIQKVHEQDSQAITEGLTAQHERDDLRRSLGAIRDLLALPSTADPATIYEAVRTLKEPDKQAAKIVNQIGDALIENAQKKKPITGIKDWLQYGWNLLLSKVRR